MLAHLTIITHNYGHVDVESTYKVDMDLGRTRKFRDTQLPAVRLTVCLSTPTE